MLHYLIHNIISIWFWKIWFFRNNIRFLFKFLRIILIKFFSILCIHEILLWSRTRVVLFCIVSVYFIYKCKFSCLFIYFLLFLFFILKKRLFVFRNTLPFLSKTLLLFVFLYWVFRAFFYPINLSSILPRTG